MSRLPRGLYGLSARLLVLTVAFVMLAEVLIFVPSVARFRQDWLLDRVADGHTAALALEATPDQMVSDELKAELLSHAGAHAVVIRKPGDVKRVLTADMPPEAARTYDFRETRWPALIWSAMMTLFRTEDRVIRVIAPSRKDREVVVEALLDDRPLRHDMYEFAWRIFALSLAISLIAAALVFLTLQWMIVRPLRRLTENMAAFRDTPDNPANVLAPSARGDEIGQVQRQLAAMEGAIRSALRQQARLAALGTAVAKINHDLRNILAAARLVSDRLADSSDPQVRQLAPRVVGAIDRAVALCGQTLDYARDDLPPLSPSRFALRGLVDDVGRVVGLLTEERARWEAAIEPGLTVEADRDQLFRVLANLGRNAVEAGAARVRISAGGGRGGAAWIEVADDGPGLPPKAREKLFTPFAGSARAGGTGLGLAVSRDLARAHGGDLALVRSTAEGTVFRLDLPRARAEAGGAQAAQ